MQLLKAMPHQIEHLSSNKFKNYSFFDDFLYLYDRNQKLKIVSYHRFKYLMEKLRVKVWQHHLA
jgi:hypothetical protein